jgi:hypothetical protein
MNEMTRGFDHWSLGRIESHARCLMEPGMTCIPLRGDRICLECYAAARAEAPTEAVA